MRLDILPRVVIGCYSAGGGSLTFQQITPQDSLCQGDLFQVFDGDVGPMWGVILTADCDIAQSKFGEYLTYAPIIHASDYIENIWAPSRLSDIVNRAALRAVDQIWRVEKRRDAEVERLDTDDLIDWVREKGAAAIIATVGTATERLGKEAAKDLGLLEAALNSKGGSVETVDTCWSLMGQSDAQKLGNLRSAISQLRSEYFYIPSIPGVDGIGFVVLLRDVQSIHLSHVFKSTTDWKLSDVSRRHIIRMGRFNDNVKYAIVQQFAFLFSRIGLEADFESQRDDSIEIFLDSMPRGAGAKS